MTGVLDCLRKKSRRLANQHEYIAITIERIGALYSNASQFSGPL
jgi:hypothetical protein